MPKASIRETLLRLRRQMPAEQCMTLSLEVQERFLDSDIFNEARSLALYSPIKNEVFTEVIFSTARSQSKQVFYPRIHGAELNFIEVGSRMDLDHGRFGILEPQGENHVEICNLDLFVVPGVAFDHAGHRLGYGRGFYDRVLSQASGCSYLIGLCFEFQRVEALPFEPHDVRMNYVMTEAGCYRCE